MGKLEQTDDGMDKLKEIIKDVSYDDLLEASKPPEKRPVGRPRKHTYYCETCGHRTGHDTAGHGTKGGKRAGAGRPKGYLTKKTLEEKRVKDAFIQRVLNKADNLFNAQMDLAVGEKSLFVKITEGEGKNRKVYHELVTDSEIIKQYLDYNYGEGVTVENPDNDDRYYYLTTKPANNQALDSLLNRAFGKAPDKLEISGGFFSQSQLTIRVVGARQDVLEIGEDGQVTGIDTGESKAELGDGAATGTDTVKKTEPSDTTT